MAKKGGRCVSALKKGTKINANIPAMKTRFFSKFPTVLHFLSTMTAGLGMPGLTKKVARIRGMSKQARLGRKSLRIMF